jgi:hypothetical protein
LADKKMARVYWVTLLVIIGFQLEAQVVGCTDPLALNFNVTAQQNDGSCVYSPASLTPVQSENLPALLTESSGLIWWEDQLWTHNDSGDNSLYSLDWMVPATLSVYTLGGVQNKDWEEISQDSQYIYLGDFGNNENGNRTDLKILRIEKGSLLGGDPAIDTLFFSYSDQVDFSGSGPNNTDFDCEAFIVGSNRIYLFTKQWVSKGCSVYSLPKEPGNHSAVWEAGFQVDGLITGATYLEGKRLVVLCGYSPLLQPFLFLLYDFNEDRFFEGNKRKIALNLPFHQVEGVCTTNGILYYASNERFNQSVLTIPQKLHRLDLSMFLESYLYPTSSVGDFSSKEGIVNLHYRAGYLHLAFSEHFLGRAFQVLDLQGRVIKRGVIQEQTMLLDIGRVASGVYVMAVEGGYSKAIFLRP